MSIKSVKEIVRKTTGNNTGKMSLGTVLIVPFVVQIFAAVGIVGLSVI
ncbi:MAG: hypothetical protein GDA48_16695 [Hormoscilla sp. GM102CHS1]|nr:hypothetical protein [Hormoscilla sp. GM102CHS1]